MSALSNLAGFFPPQGKDVWNNNLMWEPIPVHTKPEKSDEILAAKKSCPEYNRQLKKLEKSPEFKKMNHENKELYEYLTLHTGRKIHSISDVEFIHNCLFIEELYNKTLPDWTKGYYPEKMRGIAAFAFAFKTYTKPLARLKSGPLIKDILMRFRNKATSVLKPDRNLWIYSAHDTTVANLLGSLGLFKQMGYHSPPYRATVLLELRKLNNKFFVQIFYKNTTAEPEPQNIPGCGTSCALDKLFDLYSDVMPEVWEQECNPQSNLSMSFIKAQAEGSVGEFAMVSLMLFVVLLVCLIGVFYRRRYILDDRWYLRI
jgi:lysosomal acid phosphatase